MTFYDTELFQQKHTLAMQVEGEGAGELEVDPEEASTTTVAIRAVQVPLQLCQHHLQLLVPWEV